MSEAEHVSRIPGATLRLDCPKCSSQMTLSHIDPDKPGFDARTFACPSCGHVESRVFKIL